MKKLPFSVRAKKARESANLTQAAAAKLIGVSRAAVAQWENGQTKSINAEHLHSTATVYGVSSIWLATGKGDQRHKTADAGTSSNDRRANVRSGKKHEGEVPVISKIQAGSFEEAFDPYEPGVAEDWIQRACSGDKVYVLVVEGDSMAAPPGSAATFLPGEHIHVNPELRSPKVNDFIVARVKGSDSVTFKQFRIDDGKPYLHALNPAWPPIFDEFEVLGTIKAKTVSY